MLAGSLITGKAKTVEEDQAKQKERLLEEVSVFKNFKDPGLLKVINDVHSSGFQKILSYSELEQNKEVRIQGDVKDGEVGSAGGGFDDNFRHTG